MGLLRTVTETRSQEIFPAASEAKTLFLAPTQHGLHLEMRKNNCLSDSYFSEPETGNVLECNAILVECYKSLTVSNKPSP